MTAAAWIGIASIVVTLIAGFASLLWRLGRVELKIDLMWDRYMRGVDILPGGRRHTDPPARVE